MGEQQKTLRDIVILNGQGFNSSIARPTVEANNFEIKLALLQIIQQNQFGGSPSEGPYTHLMIFLEYCDTLKINRVSSDALKFHLFPFSLRNEQEFGCFPYHKNSALLGTN